MEHNPKLAVEMARRDGRPPFQRSRIDEVLVVAGVATDRTPAGVSGPRRIDRTVGREGVLQHGSIGVERRDREPLNLPVVIEGPQLSASGAKGQAAALASSGVNGPPCSASDICEARLRCS